MESVLCVLVVFPRVDGPGEQKGKEKLGSAVRKPGKALRSAGWELVHQANHGRWISREGACLWYCNLLFRLDLEEVVTCNRRG